MLKFINGILVIAVLVSASALYNLEHKTRGLERQINKTKTLINDDDEAIKLLNAEWSSLTRPERIQALAEQNLKMVPLKADQIVQASELAQRIPTIAAEVTPKKPADPIGDVLKKMQ
jgi:cell division protein FtsL